MTILVRHCYAKQSVFYEQCALCFTSEQLFTLVLSHRWPPAKLTVLQNVDRSNKSYAKPLKPGFNNTHGCVPFLPCSSHTITATDLFTGKPTINSGRWCEENVGEAQPGVPAFVYIPWPWRQRRAEGLVDQQWTYRRVLFTYLGKLLWHSATSLANRSWGGWKHRGREVARRSRCEKNSAWKKTEV